MLPYIEGVQEEQTKRGILKRLTKDSMRVHWYERFGRYDTGDGLHGVVVGSQGEIR